MWMTSCPGCPERDGIVTEATQAVTGVTEAQRALNGHLAFTATCGKPAGCAADSDTRKVRSRSQALTTGDIQSTEAINVAGSLGNERARKG